MPRYLVILGFLVSSFACYSIATAHDIKSNDGYIYNISGQTISPLKTQTVTSRKSKKRLRVVQPLPYYTNGVELEVVAVPGEGKVVEKLSFSQHVFEYDRRGDWVRISRNNQAEKWVKKSGLSKFIK